MSFLNAWALSFAAVAPLIVLLYLLKLKRRSVAVSTLMFWQRVLEENRRRALVGRLRQFWSLLLHLLIFALILLALARPVLDRTVREGASTVLVLDNRARMGALEADGRTRLQRGLEKIEQMLQQAGATRHIAVVVTAPQPSVVAPFSDDVQALRQSVTDLRPTDAGGELGPALRLAETLLVARAGATRIVLLTAPGAELAAVHASHPGTVIIVVGEAQQNVAITRFAARPHPASPETSEILLEAQNFGTAAVRGNVELSLDGRLLDVRPLSLAPGERKTELFPAVPRADGTRGWLTARWDQPDALAVDNVAFSVLPAEPPRRVLLVTEGNWFFEKLLGADARVRFELLAPEAYQPGMAAQFDAVVFDRALPREFDLATAQGNFLFLRDTPFATPEPPIEQPVVTEIDAQHPALRLVQLEHVTFARAVVLLQPEPVDGWRWEAPLRAAERPLMIAGTRRSAVGSEQRLAAFAFDVAESDLPLRVAFPLVMSHTIHWLAGSGPIEGRGVRAGETIALAPAESLSPMPAALSTEPPDAAAAEPVRGSLVPAQNGFYRLQHPSGETWIAVNTFATPESDLRSGAPGFAPIPGVATHAPAVLTRWPLWQLFALAALTLLTAEWSLYHRRRTE